MCGRYAASRHQDQLVEVFEVDEVVEPEPTGTAQRPWTEPRWNIAPTDQVAAVLERARDEHVRRKLVGLRWGLVPSWAKDPSGGARLINARRETVGSKPAFRAAYARRRCLLPADGYYEWQKDGDRKQPWFLSSRDGEPLAMAGVYEVWSAPGAEAGERLWTCTVLTTEAADELGQIHDRTPLLVPRDDWARWLDPSLEDPGEGLLVPGTPGVLDAWPVGAAVGNVRNDGPELSQPVAPDQPAGLF